ncbi:MAG: Peptidoglycan glycosyltransferase [Candidatus Falkowbacteria bacterium GW2011_GWF2_39_8]|uniref:Peptidoglycan glycosyltransferase n=1 Tax=Candidatus Falkowbacteria bacterium GW2011_GWF2_39_8 TaxID=1618642 RepID=A0A0G0Q632_9BACT|nr:MAG: Peptidoglycan glycosyltransferase [Candidatus Falkowbacteria bacterium GW2011_GWF2_39_8]
MKPWKNKKNNTEKNSRINIMIAIIFVLGGLVILKLYDLQIRNYDRYRDMAARQQQVSSKLEPKRGRIFIEDGQEGRSDLYPLATNKQFATIFAKPNMITDPQKVAESLYEIINKNLVENEASLIVAEDKEIAEQNEEFKKIKKELEINRIKDEKITEYVRILSKQGDPYELIAKKVDDEILSQVKAAKLEGIDYILESGRFYPEKNIGSQILGFVGYVGDSKEGRYGLEGFFNMELAGKIGSVKADRNAVGDLIIFNDKDYNKAEDGSDLLLTINRSIQFEACKKLSESVLRHGAQGGSVIIMDPKSGAIIAMCSSPDYDPNNYKLTKDINVYNNPVIFNQFEPGSTFKSITMAAALDQGKVAPETTFDDKGFIMVEGWPKPIKNSDYESFGGHGTTDMTTVLVNSLNTGAIYSMEKIGPQVFSQYVKKFGFGEKTGIELETESPGNISNISSKKVRPINAATASFGQGITVTALQMIGSYVAIANGGILMKPYIVKEIVNPNGEKVTTQPKQIRRVITEKTASLLTGMLVRTVEEGHAKRAQVPGYYVAGKTGTAQVASSDSKGYGAQTIHSFIGYTPINDPKFVIMTLLNDPKDARFAESTAVPLFGEIAKFALNFYQVPQERTVVEKK